MAVRMPIHVAIIGLVGKEVVAQLKLPQLSHSFHIVSLHTSKYHLLLPYNSSPSVESIISALNPSSSQGSLKAVPYEGGINGVVASLNNLPRPLVVVDCTSSTDLAALYPTILSSPMTHIVTPNKKAFSGSAALYNAIRQVQLNTSNLVYQEATVGAGLPILSTLGDLIATGDEIESIEGVFSGTLSYIFNEFSKPNPSGEGPSFSSVVKEAKEKGYTEPDPRDDLSGSDVGRKLTILARLLPGFAPLEKGFESIPTESLVYKSLEHAKSSEDFVERLEEGDEYYAKARKEAEAEGCVLRFVGVVNPSAPEGEKAKCSLQKYPFSHPFASSLSGADNIVSFKTKRYSPRPLIIQGAGAGAAVTAMGVVADMIKVGERVGNIKL